MDRVASAKPRRCVQRVNFGGVNDYFLALLPATMLTIAGYFVLYLSNRSEGTFRTFGKYLGFWAFTLAALVILGAIFAAAHAGYHCPMIGEREMYGRMHAHGDESGNSQSGANPQAPASAPNPAAPPGPTSPSPQKP
jgi:hypothetical protein